MRFYNQPHQYYCGGDLHARTLYLRVLDAIRIVPMQRNGGREFFPTGPSKRRGIRSGIHPVILRFDLTRGP